MQLDLEDCLSSNCLPMLLRRSCSCQILSGLLAFPKTSGGETQVLILSAMQPSEPACILALVRHCKDSADQRAAPQRVQPCSLEADYH